MDVLTLHISIHVASATLHLPTDSSLLQIYALDMHISAWWVGTCLIKSLVLSCFMSKANRLYWTLAVQLPAVITGNCCPDNSDISSSSLFWVFWVYFSPPPPSHNNWGLVALQKWWDGLYNSLFDNSTFKYLMMLRANIILLRFNNFFPNFLLSWVHPWITSPHTKRWRYAGWWRKMPAVHDVPYGVLVGTN